jgi:hypothetical protein
MSVKKGIVILRDYFKQRKEYTDKLQPILDWLQKAPGEQNKMTAPLLVQFANGTLSQDKLLEKVRKIETAMMAQVAVKIKEKEPLEVHLAKNATMALALMSEMGKKIRDRSPDFVTRRTAELIKQITALRSTPGKQAQLQAAEKELARWKTFAQLTMPIYRHIAVELDQCAKELVPRK